jgi:hypothetical protein
MHEYFVRRGSDYNRGTGCGRSARPGLCGEHLVTDAPTVRGSSIDAMTRFSERHGYQPDDAEITVRLEAPEELHGVIVDIAYESGLSPQAVRSIVCRVLRTRENPGNWSPFPNVDGEARDHLDSCEWYEVYDIVEAIYARLARSPTGKHGGQESYFEQEINKYFRRRGIGWQLTDGRLETRGSESFEHALAEARGELSDSGRTTAANEIHQAISDLSRPHIRTSQALFSMPSLRLSAWHGMFRATRKLLSAQSFLVILV